MEKHGHVQQLVVGGSPIRQTFWNGAQAAARARRENSSAGNLHRLYSLSFRNALIVHAAIGGQTSTLAAFDRE